MPAKIDIQHEVLTYTAVYEQPAFALWGNGGAIVRGFYDALSPYRVSLRDIQITGNTPTVADPVVTIKVGVATVKFAFGSIEVTFNSLNEEVLSSLPAFLDALTGWLKKLPDFKFASHGFVYYQHSVLEGTTIENFLSKFNPKLDLSGIDLGSGAIFNRSVPEKFWTTQITVDRSVPYPNALFLGLSIKIGTGEVEYNKLFQEAMLYYAETLRSLGLESPYLAGPKS